jgi:phosphoglycerate dehydrogenase-like enzyme
MEAPIHVLAAVDLDEAQRHTVRSIDNRIALIVNPKGFRAYLARAQNQPVDDEQQALAHGFETEMAEAEVFLSGFMLPPGMPAKSPKLRWFHTLAAGVDRMIGTPIMQSDVTITNSRGGNAVAVAEYTIWFMLSLAKQGLQLAENQRNHLWDPLVMPSLLYDRTVAIVGLGSIGEQVALRAKAFGMKVIGSRRSAIAIGSEPPTIDVLYPPTLLEEMLGQADYVVLAMPLTEETRGMIGAPQLRAMKQGAFLINIARGAVCDEEALLEALHSGHLGGAALDVFVQEPLPPDSPLWDAPNTIIAPHRSGIAGRDSKGFEYFCDNLARYCRGQSLINVVNKELGY